MELKGIDEEEEEEVIRCCSSSSLPSDAIYEILTRVELNTLRHGCRWVCKNWKALTYDSHFRQVHFQNTRTLSGYFLQYFKPPPLGHCISFISNINHSPPIPSPSLDFLPKSESISILTSTPQGLFCCVTREHHRNSCTCYYVCKPTTQQWRRIPNPRTRSFTVNIAMFVKNSEPLHYKIIRFSEPNEYPRRYKSYHCEVFDSNSWAWKRLEDVNLPYSAIFPRYSGVLINGAFHWLLKAHIFAFHVDSERWRLMEVPQEAPHIYSSFWKPKMIIVESEGRLALFYSIYGVDQMELWVVEDYLNLKGTTWKKKYSINLESIHRNLGFTEPLDLYTDDIVLLQTENEVIWFHRNMHTYRAMKVPNITIQQVHSLHSDFVLCNL